MIFFPAASRLMPRRAWERRNFIKLHGAGATLFPALLELPDCNRLSPVAGYPACLYHNTTLNKNSHRRKYPALNTGEQHQHRNEQRYRSSHFIHEKTTFHVTYYWAS